MTKTDKFFPGGEWSEEAYEKYAQEEATLLAERIIAPWQPAMREWLKNGGIFPVFIPQHDPRRCTLMRYCRGELFRQEHGYVPCIVCPYGCDNFKLFKDLSRALHEFRTD